MTGSYFDERIWCSADGITWKKATLPEFTGNDDILGIAYGANKYIVVGESGLKGKLVYSDAQQWQ
jgi:hypothetical protein